MKVHLFVTDSIDLRTEDGGVITLLPQMHVWAEKSSWSSHYAVFELQFRSWYAPWDQVWKCMRPYLGPHWVAFGRPVTSIYASFQWRPDGTIECSDARIQATWDNDIATFRIVKVPGPTFFGLDGFVCQYNLRLTGEHFEIKPAFEGDKSFEPFRGSAEAVLAFMMRKIASDANPDRAEKLSGTIKGYLSLAAQCPGQQVFLSI